MNLISVRKEELDFRSQEAYKTLRTNIDFSGENVQVVALTSATPNEGKSTISYQLALSFAEAGKKTLLIDADLRKSVMRQHISNGNIEKGLTNILVGKATFDEVISQTDVDNFYMLVAVHMPPNPSELLGGKAFDDLIAKAREEFDMIIIDTPPIGSVIDAAVISKNADGVLVVIASGIISYRFEKKVIEQLKTAGAKILGVVLNKVEIGGKRYGYYGKYYSRYYSRYYGKYYGDEYK